MNKPTQEVVVLTDVEELEPIIAPQGIITTNPLAAIGTFTGR